MASSAKGEDVSLAAQLAAEVTTSDAAMMQNAAGPNATTQCAPRPCIHLVLQHHAPLTAHRNCSPVLDCTALRTLGSKVLNPEVLNKESPKVLTPTLELRLWDSEAGILHRSGIAARGSNLTLNTGAAMLPHSEKANKAGEDAYFISECGRYFGALPGLRASSHFDALPDIGIKATHCAARGLGIFMFAARSWGLGPLR